MVYKCAAISSKPSKYYRNHKPSHYSSILHPQPEVVLLSSQLTPDMSPGRSPCDSLVLNDDKSSVKVADFNDPSVCVYVAILNRLGYVPSGHTCFCQFENTCERGAPRCFRIQHGRSHRGLWATWRCSLVIGQHIRIKLNC